LRLLEISQVGRRLVLPGGHQKAVCTQEIIILADDDVIVVLGTIVFHEDIIAVATVVFGHHPRPRQRVVDHRELVVQDILIVLVQINPLLDDALIVRVEWQAAVFVGAWTADSGDCGQGFRRIADTDSDPSRTAFR
jgi:hypothetical protein